MLDNRPSPGRPAERRRTNVYIDGYNFYVPLSAHGSREVYELAWCDFLKFGSFLVDALAREQPSVFGGCELGSVKYFTATIPEGLPSNPSGLQRKRDWLDALHYHTKGLVEIVHGTFRAREHRFYIDREELDELARCGIPVDWSILDPHRPTFHPKLRIYEEKQTDVMLACSVLTDVALGAGGAIATPHSQTATEHFSNSRPSPAPCSAAVIVSADTDFLPAAEMAARIFRASVAVAFTYPHCAYQLKGEFRHLSSNLLTREVSEQELRTCRLPAEVLVPDGRVIRMDHFLRTHFERFRATGG